MRCARRCRAGSLRHRLLGAAVASAVLTTALAVFIYGVLWRSDLLTHADLEEEAQELSLELTFDERGVMITPPSDAPWMWPYQVVPHEMKFVVLNDAGEIALASEPRTVPMLPADGKGNARKRHFNAVEQDIALVVFTQPYEVLGKQYWLQVARSERISEFLDARLGGRLLKAGLATALFALVLFALLVLGTIHRLLRPLREVSAAAEAITPARLDARLETGNLPRELVPLVEGFNQALQRVERGFRVQQDFLATAAHELKTPLALVRGQIELSAIPERAQLLEDLDGMARQVHQLLHLAEVSETGNYTFAEVDVREVVKQALEPLERLARKTGVNLVTRLMTEPLVRQADRGALIILVKNLVENAIHHSQPGDIVAVDLTVSSLSVRDEGCGVPPSDLPRLFERFWRGPDSMGAGLGLAICQEIAQAHGWRLTAHNGTPGMVFELHLTA